MSNTKSAIGLTPLQQGKIDQAAKDYASDWHKANDFDNGTQRATPSADFKAGASYYEKECMPGELEKAMEWISLKGLYQEIDGRWYDKFGGKVRMVAETTKDLLVLFEKYKHNGRIKK